MKSHEYSRVPLKSTVYELRACGWWLGGMDLRKGGGPQRDGHVLTSRMTIFFNSAL